MRQGDIFSSACRWGSPGQHRHGSPTAARAAHRALGHLHVHSRVLTGFNGTLPAHFLSLRHHLPGQLTPPRLHTASHHHCWGHPVGQRWSRGAGSMSAPTPRCLFLLHSQKGQIPAIHHRGDATQHPMAGYSQHAPGDANLTLASTLAWKIKREKQFLPLTTEAFLASNNSPRVLDAELSTPS